MRATITSLEKLIDQHLDTLKGLPENEMSLKPSPSKWSKKEIMGHLIDSAQNNIRRFILAQYEDSPYIVYNQDQWVLLSAYQQWHTRNIIELWYQLNKQVCRILENIPAAMYDRPCRTQDTHSIKWLATDYLRHLLHHLHAVLELEPVPYP